MSLEPIYELQFTSHGPDDNSMEIWQLPAPGTPHIKKPRRVARLRGRNLSLVEPQVTRCLKREGIKLPSAAEAFYAGRIGEDAALYLGLLFRMLAPMRDAVQMRQIAVGIDNMASQELGYWLGMAMHRKKPGRALKALRIMLGEPL